MYRSYSLNSRSLSLAPERKNQIFKTKVQLINISRKKISVQYILISSVISFRFLALSFKKQHYSHRRLSTASSASCPTSCKYFSRFVNGVQIFMRLTLGAFNIMPRTTVAKINLRFWLVLASSLIIICFVDQNNPNVTVQRAHFEGFFTIQSITLELINGKLKKGFPMLPDFQCT